MSLPLTLSNSIRLQQMPRLASLRRLKSGRLRTRRAVMEVKQYVVLGATESVYALWSKTEFRTLASSSHRCSHLYVAQNVI